MAPRLIPKLNSPTAVAAAPTVASGRVTKTKVKTEKTKTQVTFACGECRSKKSKCGGERPACASCVKKGRECVYVGNEDETREQRWQRLLREEQTKVRNLESAINSEFETTWSYMKSCSVTDISLVFMQAKSFAEFVSMFEAAKVIMMISKDEH